MQEASPPKTRTNTHSGKFIDTLIEQWTKRTGSNIALNQTEEVAENSIVQDGKQQILQNQERTIQTLQRKLKKCQETEVSLSASLEVEVRNREEIQTKLNATWESVDTITEYFNYISESLTSFQQHRANLSALYDNVIQKQQEAIQKLQLNSARSKDLQNDVTHLQSKLLLEEGRLREMLAEQNELRKQLKNSEYNLQSQKNELVRIHGEEKQTLVKEQQQLLFECEHLKLQLQNIEQDKSDIAKVIAQLENKLLLQEERMQETLTERNNLQRQIEDIEREFYSQRNDLVNAHVQEKNTLIEEQQRLLTDYENLQSRVSTLEKEKSDIIEKIVQKDALVSKLQNDNFTYKNQIETIMKSNSEAYSKCEVLEEKQNMWEQELRTKMEKIQGLETTLNATKQKETALINDIDKIEKKLINEMDYSKTLEMKFSNAQRDLNLSQIQYAETQKSLEKTTTTSELVNIKLQKQIKSLQREMEEIIKRESIKIKDAEVLYENIKTKHIEEVSSLKNSYEARLLELKKTVDCLNVTMNSVREENSVLNMSLMEMRAENSSLRTNYQLIVERSDDLQGKLQEVTETLQKKLITEQKEQKSKNTLTKNPKQANTKRKYEVSFNPEIMEISEANQCNVSTSIDLSEDQQDKSLSRLYPIERESQKEQETEVTSAGKKFFKSRPVQPRTYIKRQQK